MLSIQPLQHPFWQLHYIFHHTLKGHLKQMSITTSHYIFFTLLLSTRKAKQDYHCVCFCSSILLSISFNIIPHTVRKAQECFCAYLNQCPWGKNGSSGLSLCHSVSFWVFFFNFLSLEGDDRARVMQSL